jgi:hypothetical protein
MLKLAVQPFLKRKYNRRDPNRPLLFLHIPKSAGSSLAMSIDRAIQPKQAIIAGFDDILYGTFDDFAGMTPAESARVYVGENKLPKTADFVAGHFSYKNLLKTYPKGQAITILREPSSRILSHWLYWRGLSDQELAGIGGWGDRVLRARKPFGEFLSDPDIYCTTDNLTIRMLLSPHPLIPVSAAIEPCHDAQLLREARKVMSKFSYIDTVENPDLPKRIGAWLGGNFQLSRDNVTRPTPPALQSDPYREFDQDTLDLLEARTRMDRVLWHAVVSRCEPGIDSRALERNTIIRNLTRGAASLLGSIRTLDQDT